jgi:hypothetical protein
MKFFIASQTKEWPDLEDVDRWIFVVEDGEVIEGLIFLQEKWEPSGFFGKEGWRHILSCVVNQTIKLREY